MKFRSVEELSDYGYKLVGKDRVQCEEYLKVFRYLLLNVDTGVIHSPISEWIATAEKA